MSRSQTLFEAARQVIPGGVNSPVRAFGAVGGTPIFIQRAEGPYLYDEDGRRYIDYVGSWGPMIVGHNHPKVREAVMNAAENGLSFGAPTALEVEMANTLQKLVPSIEKVRMVNSGTEATMSAIRLARGYTGRNDIIKFEGCYHGHADSLLVKAGSGALTFGQPNSPGIPEAFARHTLVARYNDLDSVEALLKSRGDQVAAIIVEPVAGNMNCIPPTPEFLPGLRKLCDQYGALLIFDEVMTGFRVGLGGAQSRYGVMPDLTTLGKIVGGGMPVGAFGGRADIMAKLAPEGSVYQAGTLSGNPVAMAAGLAMLQLVQAPGFYEKLEARCAELLLGLRTAADRVGIDLHTTQVGGMFGLFFVQSGFTGPMQYYEQVTQCRTEMFSRFFHFMLEQGVYLAPSAFEAGFVSSEHDADIIGATIEAAEKAFHRLRTETE